MENYMQIITKKTQKNAPQQMELIRCSSVHMQIIITFKSHILIDPALHPDASRAADSENSRQVIGAE